MDVFSIVTEVEMNNNHQYDDDLAACLCCSCGEAVHSSEAFCSGQVVGSGAGLGRVRPEWRRDDAAGSGGVGRGARGQHERAGGTTALLLPRLRLTRYIPPTALPPSLSLPPSPSPAHSPPLPHPSVSLPLPPTALPLSPSPSLPPRLPLTLHPSLIPQSPSPSLTLPPAPFLLPHPIPHPPCQCYRGCWLYICCLPVSAIVDVGCISAVYLPVLSWMLAVYLLSTCQCYRGTGDAVPSTSPLTWTRCGNARGSTQTATMTRSTRARQGTLPLVDVGGCSNSDWLDQLWLVNQLWLVRPTLTD